MILIQRYILKELFYNGIFTFVVISLVMLLVLAVKVIFQSPLGFLAILRAIPLMLTASLSIVIPASVLVSTVMTYGRMAADNEIVTLRASGMHVLRVLVPGVFFGLFASLLLLVVNDRLVPRAERRVRSMVTVENFFAVLDAGLLRGIKEQRLNDWLLTWESTERRSEAGGRKGEPPIEQWRFHGLRAKQYDRNNELVREIRAASALIETSGPGGKAGIVLRDGEVVFGRQKGTRFREIRIPFDFSQRDYSTVRLAMRDFPALAAMLRRKYKAYPDYKVSAELHSRIAHSLGPLVLVLLSLPVAVLFRQQNRMVAFLIAVLLALFVYYPVTIVGETLADDGVLTPALCIWPGSVFLALLGFVLILKVMKR